MQLPGAGGGVDGELVFHGDGLPVGEEERTSGNGWGDGCLTV